MNLFSFRTIFLGTLLSLVATAIPSVAQRNSMVFVVNSTTDAPDSNPGDMICADGNGGCTLRAAIEEANRHGFNGGDAIVFAFQQPAVIELSLGELSITRNVNIVGPGARRLTIQRSLAPGTPNFRIFHIGEFNGLGGIATIQGLSIKNGRIEGALFGGGIHVEQRSTLHLTDVTMQDNFALYGGGVAAYGGRVNINRCLFTGNTGNNNGGALYLAENTSASATIANSTITLNSAGSSGAIHGGGAVLLVNNTISHNSAANFCSSICSYPEGSVRALNNIIANDNSPTASSIGGAFVSLGNNIVSDSRGSTGFVNGVNNDQVSESNAINPLLGSLTDNGAQVNTRALLAGSPAINAANDCVFSGTCGLPQVRFRWDQRIAFNRRSDDRVDIGAYESASVASSGSWSVELGLFTPTGSLRNSIAIMMNTRTGEMHYAPVRPFGHFGYSNLVVGDVYVLEIKSKRLVNYPTQILELQ